MCRADAPGLPSSDALRQGFESLSTTYASTPLSLCLSAENCRCLIGNCTLAELLRRYGAGRIFDFSHAKALSLGNG